MYETRGTARFFYSYDSNGILYSVKYTLTDSSSPLTYYYTHNSRGDIVGIYNEAGELMAHYEYDAWGNVLSVTDQNGNAITSATHIGNLNPFRYRGYYLDAETGLYYLMSRYYDPVMHRFINADGYFQSGGGILDTNMSSYCRNNPVMYADKTGEMTYSQMQQNLVSGNSCDYDITDVTRAMKDGYGPNDELPEVYYSKRGGNFLPRKDPKKGSQDRQPTGDRERNVGHPNGEEHSRVPKGNGIKRVEETPFSDRAWAFGTLVVAVVATVVLVADDASGVGAADDVALASTVYLIWDSASKAFG